MTHNEPLDRRSSYGFGSRMFNKSHVLSCGDISRRKREWTIVTIIKDRNMLFCITHGSERKGSDFLFFIIFSSHAIHASMCASII